MLVILFELWKHFSDVVNHQLRQLSIIIFNNEAKELSVAIVNDISHFFLKWERRQLLPFKFGVVFAYMQNIDLILNLICLVHIICDDRTIQPRLCHVSFVRVDFRRGSWNYRIWFFGDATHDENEVFAETKAKAIGYLHRELDRHGCPDFKFGVVSFNCVREFVSFGVQTTKEIDELVANFAC